jgi:dTDP-glucose 4,6-dehydratase
MTTLSGGRVKPVLFLLQSSAGAGFIGSNVILHQMQDESVAILNPDKLTYARNLRSGERIAADGRYKGIQGDIGDRERVRELLETYGPGAIVNFAGPEP